MIYRVTAKFFDTEAAQRAARRINGIKDDVYEVRLCYMGERQYDSPVYGGNNISSFPPTFDINRRFYNIFDGVENTDMREISDECFMSVFCKDSINTVVSEAIINCGGYDITTEEEKLL